MNAFIRPSDYRFLFSFASPLTAFAFPWLIAIAGQQAQLSGIVQKGWSSFHTLILANMASFLLLAFLLQSCRPLKLDIGIIRKQLTISAHFIRIVKCLALCFIAMELVQIAYSKGFPLLWLLVKSKKTYVDFGIPSINGLLNAVYLFITTAFYLIYQRTEKKSDLCLWLLLLTVPIFLISRQLLMTIFLQVTCCMLICHAKALRTLFFSSAALLTLFIWIGNYRTGIGALAKILEPVAWLPKWSYPLLWIYAYMVTPLNNMHANIDHIRPLMAPLYELNTFLPTAIRRLIIDQGALQGTQFTLVHENMTVSSFYLEPILDYGQVYAFLLMAAFQLFTLFTLRQAIKSCSPRDLILYSVCYGVMTLSIFGNLLLYQPVIFQIVLLSLSRLQFVKSSWKRFSPFRKSVSNNLFSSYQNSFWKFIKTSYKYFSD